MPHAHFAGSAQSYQLTADEKQLIYTHIQVEDPCIEEMSIFTAVM